MTFQKPAPTVERILERRIDTLLHEMDAATKSFLYENPDVLKAALDGRLLGYFERLRLKVPYEKTPSPRMEDVLAVKALSEDGVLMSGATWTVVVDYRPKRDEAIKAAQLFQHDMNDSEDLEDLTECRRIIRVGGLVIRRLKRLWFEDACCQSEIDGVIRLKGWKKVDARTLLAWSLLQRKSIEPHEYVVATEAPKLRRGGTTVVLSSSVTKQRDKTGTFYQFRRDDIRVDPVRDAFSRQHSFLVEVPDDRGT